MTILCLLWFMPTLGVAVTSFRTVDDAQSSGWWTVLLHPSSLTTLTTTNYVQAFSGTTDLQDAFASSVAIALPATVIPVLVAAHAAYAFTFMHFRGRRALFVLLVAMLVVPNQVAVLPLLKLYVTLGIEGTYAAAWLAHVGFAMPLAIYVLRGHMNTLPTQIIDAARVDGASHFQLIWKIVIPMSTPALASLAIFQFLWVWNDFFVALVFIGPGPNAPLPLAVQGLLGQLGQGWQLLTAGGVILMLVPVTVFLTLQRYFVHGLLSAAVEG